MGLRGQGLGGGGFGSRLGLGGAAGGLGDASDDTGGQGVRERGARSRGQGAWRRHRDGPPRGPGPDDARCPSETGGPIGIGCASHGAGAAIRGTPEIWEREGRRLTAIREWRMRRMQLGWALYLGAGVCPATCCALPSARSMIKRPSRRRSWTRPVWGRVSSGSWVRTISEPANRCAVRCVIRPAVTRSDICTDAGLGWPV